MGYSNIGTGNYMLASSRKKIIERLRFISTRPAFDISYSFVAKEYLKDIILKKPEWII